MKKIITISAFTIAALFVTAGFARNTVAKYSVNEALTSEQGQQIPLSSGMQFYFGTELHGAVVQDFGKIKVNKKTNAFGKSDERACQWAFLSAMKNLKQQAIKRGANAIINIQSNYKNNLTSSNTQFTCGAGATVAGVALVGEAVKIDDNAKPIAKKKSEQAVIIKPARDQQGAFVRMGYFFQRVWDSFLGVFK